MGSAPIRLPTGIRGTTLLVIAAVTLAVGVAGWRIARAAHEPSLWEEFLARSPLFEELPNDRRSPEWREASRLITNDLLRRPRWSAAEADTLISLIARNQGLGEIDPAALDAGTMTKLAVSEGAAAAVAERFRHGGPIDPPARAALANALLSQLAHPSSDVRFTGIQTVVYSGIVEQPQARATIEALAAADPSPRVRDQADRQLKGFDSCRAVWEELKRRRGDRP